jgi:hypothetical protein
MSTDVSEVRAASIPDHRFDYMAVHPRRLWTSLLSAVTARYRQSYKWPNRNTGIRLVTTYDSLNVCVKSSWHACAGHWVLYIQHAWRSVNGVNRLYRRFLTCTVIVQVHKLNA